MVIGLSTFSAQRLVVLAAATVLGLLYLSTSSNTEVVPTQLEPPNKTYREQLASVLAKDHIVHSRTLFSSYAPADKSAIYVVSLARRTDRRAILEKLAAALELDFTYVDATDASDHAPGGDGELVDMLYRRVAWQRWTRLDERDLEPGEVGVLPKGYDEVSDDKFVLHAFPFEWSEEVRTVMDGLAPGDGGGASGSETPAEEWAGADFWDTTVPGADEWAKRHPMDDFALPATGPSWRTRLHSASMFDNIRKAEVLRHEALACAHSHIRILRDIVHRNLSIALIMEDDIDIEFHIQKTLYPQLPSLPSDWDVLFLGHCHSQEYTHAPLPHAPRFRPTYHTLCLHGYALSAKGARKLLRFLRSADYAYAMPIDHAVKDLVQRHYLKSYSAYPPLIIQRKEDVSDIVGQAGLVASWHEVEGELTDSTWARVKAYETLRMQRREDRY